HPTTITFESAPNPSAPQEEVTLTATVTDPAGIGTPSGSVDFHTTDGVGLGAAPLDNTGLAQVSTTQFELAGDHQVLACYSGDETFAGRARLSMFTPSSNVR